jgi:membrane protease YdiL (CAAX protease family)
VAKQLHPDLWSILLGSVASLPLLLGLVWTLRTRVGAIQRLVELVQDQLGPVLTSRSSAELALLAALAGVAEELLFRGVIQAELAERVPGLIALILASAAFGLAHFLTLTYALLAMVAGLYLGALFWLQGNLVIPIVAHAVYDYFALTYLVRRYRARTISE